MKAKETNLLELMKKTDQFIIPIYQRPYSWTNKQCAQIWEDLRRLMDDQERTHFVGSIVYIERGLYQSTGFSPLLVIDGQQRLTTVTLILISMMRAMQKFEGSQRQSRKIRNQYLIDPDEVGEQSYRLVPSPNDKDALRGILEEKQPNMQTAMWRNYLYFNEKIAVLTERQLNHLNGAIGRLLVVDIALDRQRDNPQAIFESLNSTGLKLSQADLIRNFVLMDLETKIQNDMYQRYWQQMERAFGPAYNTDFDGFMRHYLTMKMHRIPNKAAVYETFKQYRMDQQGVSIETLLTDLCMYASCYVEMAYGQATDKSLKRVFADIRVLRMDVAYPAMLEVYQDFKDGKINLAEFTTILRLMESYVFRRAVCGVATNALNKIFMTFMSKVDKSHYLASVKYLFLAFTGSKKFRHDDEFKNELVQKDIYNFRSRNYLLSRLENEDRKEWVQTGEYTIEHIMPQNRTLNEAWREMLGEQWKNTQEAYLHTLGNLTLTGYNSELSDRPFQEKQSMEGGFKDSPLRLNRFPAQATTWNGDTIQERARSLAEKATQIWSFPILNAQETALFSESEEDQTQRYSLSNHVYLSGSMSHLFEKLRRRLLALDVDVKEDILKLYVAFKYETNFVDVIGQAKRLKLSLNINMEDVYDPQGLCIDMRGKGTWGNGNVEIHLDDEMHLDAAVALADQALKRQMDAAFELEL